MATENLLLEGITLRGLEINFQQMIGEQLLCSPNQSSYPIVDDMLAIAWEYNKLRHIDQALINSIYYHLLLQDKAEQLPTIEQHHDQWAYAYRIAPKTMELIEFAIGMI